MEDIIDKNCKFGLGFVNNHDIDLINIKNATLLAMKNSIENIGLNIDAALIDGKDKILNVDLKLRAFNLLKYVIRSFLKHYLN